MNPPFPLISTQPAAVPKAAPFLPMSRAEMNALGWEQCDVILVTGDAYIDHPSFGMALVGRLLESQGFRVIGRSERDSGGRPFPILHMAEPSAGESPSPGS